MDNIDEISLRAYNNRKSTLIHFIKVLLLVLKSQFIADIQHFLFSDSASFQSCSVHKADSCTLLKHFFRNKAKTTKVHSLSFTSLL